MEINYAHLCRHASERDGMLSITDIFSESLSPGFPAGVDGRVLVFDIAVTQADRGRRFPVRLELADPRGVPIWHFDAEVEIPAGPAVRDGHVPIPLQLPPLVFPAPGRYKLKIWLDGRLKKTLPWTLTQEPEA